MEVVSTEDRIVFADGAYTMEEIYASMTPARLRSEFYYKQIAPVKREHTTQMLSVWCDPVTSGAKPRPGAIQAAKRAVLGVLEEKINAGEIDAEMGEIAKEEFELIRVAR